METRKLGQAPLLKGNISSFSNREISESIMKGRILSLYLETKAGCTLRCSFCYTAGWKGEAEARQLSIEDMKKAVDVAAERGAKSIIIAGKGEPLLDPALLPLVRYATEKGLWTVLFTNGTLITKEIAEELYSLSVSVMAKLGSLDSEKQDQMVGVPGAHERIRKGLELLIEAGFRQPRLGVDTTILRSNMSEMEDIWRYLRKREIVPYLEPLIVEGAAKQWSGLQSELVPAAEIFALFERLREIDAEEFGYDLNIDATRTPGTPGCEQVMRPLIALTVRNNGDVGRCVNTDIRQKAGNIFNDGSDIAENLRAIITSMPPLAEPLMACCEGCRKFAEK